MTTDDRFAALRKYVADCEAAGLVDINGDIVTLRALLDAADERDKLICSVRAQVIASATRRAERAEAERDHWQTACRDAIAAGKVVVEQRDAFRVERDRLAAALKDTASLLLSYQEFVGTTLGHDHAKADAVIANARAALAGMDEKHD